MTKGRLEAFSDGVIAIIITIMVLELRPPAGDDWSSLCALEHEFFVYLLSFVFLGIYWNNHHHMLHATDRVTGSVLWANLHLLFWLSLVPFTTRWMGEHEYHAIPTAVYGIDLLMAAIAYTILQSRIVRAQGPQSRLKLAVGSDLKGKVSLASYATAIPAALWLSPWIAIALYVLVALIWLIPDRRIESHMHV
ncbi:MAG: TMEM175 family protein [Planctomycetota bacterium]